MIRSGLTRMAVLLLVTAVAACVATPPESHPPAGASESFADAINSKDIDAAMAHWSEDALLYFQAGGEDSVVVNRDGIRGNYEHMFEDDHAPRLAIQVDGVELLGEIAHEWGTYAIGESTGCFVLVRRAVDGWKIYREWIVEPCGHGEEQESISGRTATGTHYVVHGHGEPVALVHGFSQTHEMWFQTPLYQALRNDYQVIAVDLPGHGESDKPHDPEAYGRKIEARLIEVLDDLHVDRAHFVGFSMGASIVGGLLASHPERIRTATLGSGLFTTWSDDEEDFARQTERRGQSGERFPWEPVNQDFKALAAVIRGARQAVLDDEEIAGIVTPTLVVFGSREVDHGTGSLADLPKSFQTLIIDGADHDSEHAAVMTVEFAEAVKRLIDNRVQP